jgi:hypothetical protein
LAKGGILSQRQLLKPVRFVRGSGVGDLKVDVEVKKEEEQLQQVEVEVNGDDATIAQELAASVVVEDTTGDKSLLEGPSEGPSSVVDELSMLPPPDAPFIEETPRYEIDAEMSNDAIAASQTPTGVSPSPPPVAEQAHTVALSVESLTVEPPERHPELAEEQQQLFVVDSVGDRNGTTTTTCHESSYYAGPVLGDKSPEESDSDMEDQVLYVPPTSSANVSAPASDSGGAKPYMHVVTENIPANVRIRADDAAAQDRLEPSQSQSHRQPNGQKMSKSAKRRHKREGRARRKRASRWGDNEDEVGMWEADLLEPGSDLEIGDEEEASSGQPSPERRQSKKKSNGDVDALSDYIQNVMKTSSSADEAEVDDDDMAAAEAAMQSFVSSMSVQHMSIDDLEDERRLIEAEMEERERERGGWTTEEGSSSSAEDEDVIDVEERLALRESTSGDDDEDDDEEELRQELDESSEDEDEDELFNGKMSWASADEAYIDGIQVCSALSLRIYCESLLTGTSRTAYS